MKWENKTYKLKRLVGRWINRGRKFLERITNYSLAKSTHRLLNDVEYDMKVHAELAGLSCAGYFLGGGAAMHFRERRFQFDLLPIFSSLPR